MLFLRTSGRGRAERAPEPRRARGYACAFARHLDVEVLREALSQMLYEQWDDWYLVFLLAIEEREPPRIARDLGVTQATLLDALRDAVADLSLLYEDLAYQGIVQSEQERKLAKATGKRR